MIIGIIENEKRLRDRFCEMAGAAEGVDQVLCWASAESFLKDPAMETADLCFIDIRLQDMNGIELAEVLTEKHPSIKKVMLTNMNSDDIIFKALKNGAVGYLLKSETENLADAVRIVSSGGAIITPTIALHVMDFFRPKTSGPELKVPLTDKEKQVLEQLAQGVTPAQISDLLKIKITTVRFHIRNIYEKLNVNNRSQLTVKMKDLGMI